MSTTILSRTLSYEENGQPRTLSQDELLTRRESLVVLGEAGMGKTELMRWLGQGSVYTYITARKLNNTRPDSSSSSGRSPPLAIDALDELSTRGEGDAVDAVLQKLGDLKYPRFVLSCRAADWRNATATSALADFYGENQVLVLHLNPLTDSDVFRLLAERLGDEVRAGEVISHFERAKLGGLLRNPQTLQLIVAVADCGPLPEAKGALFERAVDVLRKEHRDGKVDLQPDEIAAFDAAGAAFATLILTGSGSITVSSAVLEDGELALAELLAMPGGSALRPVLGTRLFATAGSAGHFTYWHRSIGEFLGARWLAKQADSVMARRRTIALFRSHGLVPASLRGLHAWLAYHHPDLAVDVIAADPIGVIEYGDADALSVPLAKALLDALGDIASRDLSIDGSKLYPAKSLVAPELHEHLRAILVQPKHDFICSAVVLDSIKDCSLAASFRAELLGFLADPEAAWTLRLKALDALIDLKGEDWQAHIEGLLDAGERGWQVIRAIEKVSLEAFDDQFLVRCLVLHALSKNTSVSTLMRFEATAPGSRLEAILDELVVQVEALPGDKSDGCMMEINALAFELISRLLQSNTFGASRVWQWLKPFRADVGYRQTGQDKLAAIFAGDDALRRGIQRLALLGEPGDRTVFRRVWSMTSRSRGLALTEGDIVEHLNSLERANVDDQVWRDLVCATPHSSSEGELARAAAKRVVANRPDMVAWIDKLTTPAKPEWQERSERNQRARAARNAVRWQGHREQFSKIAGALSQGADGAVFGPARAYLGHFSDLPQGESPVDRLTKWLGEELASAALAGFEAYLQSSEPPTSQEVAAANVDGSRLKGAFIVAVALAERVRTGRGFADVSDDRLIVGYYETRHGHLEEQAKIQGLRLAIEAEMRLRGLIESSIRAWVEPQLQHRLANADQIHELFWREAPPERAADIAQDWLERFPQMAESPEFEAIHRLIDSHRFEDLRQIASQRATYELSEDRRRNWDAVRFLVALDAHRVELESIAVRDPLFLWAIRGVVRRRRDEALSARLTVAQLEFVITNFRQTWPWVDRPEGTSMGDTNPWDATEFIGGLMRRLTDMTSDDALLTVNALSQFEDDGYDWRLKLWSAEQLRKVAEERYTPHALQQVRAVVQRDAPKSVADVQATTLVLLEQVQKRILADSVDSWRGFIGDDGTPYDEERCRDHLLILLGNRPEGVDLQPEGHMAADNRADIIASVAALRLPIEVKGQWHKDLWHAADTQLDRLYATDYGADRLGIYLVFWFGPAVGKKLASPGKGKAVPKTSLGLQKQLAEGSSAAKAGRIAVVVLDLERLSVATRQKS